MGHNIKDKINQKQSIHHRKLTESGRSPKVIEKDQLKTMAKINHFSNGFGLFDKSKCSDIYNTVKVDGLNMYELRSKRVMIKYKLDKKIVEQ